MTADVMDVPNVVQVIVGGAVELRLLDFDTRAADDAEVVSDVLEKILRGSVKILFHFFCVEFYKLLPGFLFFRRFISRMNASSSWS